MSARALALLALAAALGVLLAAPGAGAGSAEFRDPEGDSGTAADVTDVAVGNGSTNNVAILVKLANRPAIFGTASSVWIDMDTDRNPATGADGADYFFVVDGATKSFDFGKWNGTAWEAASTEGIGVSFETGVLTIVFNARHIGGSTHFDFWISTYEGANFDGDHDYAPDGDGVWTFQLTPPKIAAAAARYAVLAPKAGARFAVTGVLAELEDATTVRPPFTCRATLAGKALKPVGKCAWVTPRTAKGKTLAVFVTATHAGATFTLKTATFKLK